MWNNAQLRTTVTGFSRCFVANTNVFWRCGLIKNIEHIISEILFKLKNFWSSYVKMSQGPVFWDTDCQVVIVAMKPENTQLVLSQFKNF